MANKYVWDIEELNIVYTELTQQKEYLQDNKDFLVNLSDTVNQNWQGLAGEEFQYKLGVNINDFNSLITELTEQLEVLDYVINQCYQPCEDEIKDNLMKLLNAIEG